MRKELKQLIEEYCQGLVPTEEQENEIMMKALDMDEDPEEILAYMEEVKLMKSKAQLQAEAKAKAEAEAKAEQERKEQEKQRIEAEAKAKAEAEARERIAAKEAEERAKAEAAKAEAAKAQAEAARAQAEAARAQAEAEAERLRAERAEKAAAKAKAKAEAKAAEEKARAEREARLMAENAKKEAEQKAKEEAAATRNKFVLKILAGLIGIGAIASIMVIWWVFTDDQNDYSASELELVESEVIESLQEDFEIGDVEDIDPSEYETTVETEAEVPQKSSEMSSTNDIDDNPDADLKITPDVLAEFPGGLEAMMKYIEDNTMYPAMEFNRGEECSVIMNFIIERDGSVSNVKVSTSTNPTEGFHEEAIRTIKSMPKWTPAMKNGKPIRSNVGTSVAFKLPK